MHDMFTSVIQLLQVNDHLSNYAAVWCIAWAGYEAADIIPDDFSSCIFKRLVGLWERLDLPHEFMRMISWGLRSICKPDLQKDVFPLAPGLAEAIEINYIAPRNAYDKQTAIHLAILMGHWTKEEIQNRLDSEETLFGFVRSSRFLKERGFHERGETAEIIKK